MTIAKNGSAAAVGNVPIPAGKEIGPTGPARRRIRLEPGGLDVLRRGDK